MKWSENDIKKKLKAGTIQGYKINNQAIKKVPGPKVEPKQVTWMRDSLQSMEVCSGYKIEEEYKFHPKRRWRFDFALPELRIAIEYEGIQSEKSRHTTLKGYTGDSEKYNEAQRLGWKVLRYTVLNYQSVTIDLKIMLRDHSSDAKKI